ncbi:MAG: hypothetical protein RBT62_04585 [Spirochaetia bacterium]|jgi:hypothetical protein|nr:hypothetical protein [Spirochaetia bacterium]
MLAQLEYQSLLVPLLAFLASRAIAVLVEKRLSGSATGLLVILGAASATFYSLVATNHAPTGLYWIAADAVSMVAMMAAGYSVRLSQNLAVLEQNLHRRWRCVLAGLVPLATGLSLAIGFGIVNGSEHSDIIRVAAILAAAIWLGRMSGPGLLASGLALALASTLSTGAAGAALATTILAAILAMAAGFGKTSPGLVSFIALAFPALALGLAWSLKALGLPWPAAGLAAGLSLALVRANFDDGTSRSDVRKASGLWKLATGEAYYSLAFIAGYGMNLKLASANALAIGIIGGSMLLSAFLQSLIAGKRTSYLPNQALAFAALLVARKTGLAGDALMAGVALAYLIAIPLKRGSRDMPGAGQASTPIKALVGVSTKGATYGVLSFAASLGARADPIRAVCVASIKRGSGVSTTEAEEALVRCVATGTSADIRVLPSVIVSASVPDGLARAALERHADAVLIGLGEGMPLVEGEINSALEGLLVAFPGAVVAIQRAEAFRTSRRLIAMAVAGVETSTGFKTALEASARAWGRPIGAMEAFMIGGTASALVEASDGMLEERSVTSVQTWRDVPSALTGRVSASTSFVVFSSRPGDSTWNPGHERLPVVLDTAFSDSTIILWFLPKPATQHIEAGLVSETADGDGEPVTSTERFDAVSARQRMPPIIASAFDSGRILTDMREEALVDAIRKLTDAIMNDDRVASGRLASLFSSIARKTPIELSEGVLLLHAHARGVSLPTLAIGARPSGWPLVALSSPVRILIAIVSPYQSGPQIHLEALTQIATAFRSQGLADQLLAPCQQRSPV